MSGEKKGSARAHSGNGDWQQNLKGGTRAEGVARGAFARVKGTTRPVILSCSHVIFPGFVAVPHQGVYQPKVQLVLLERREGCVRGLRPEEIGFLRILRAVSSADTRTAKWFGGFNNFPGTKVGFGGTKDKGGPREQYGLRNRYARPRREVQERVARWDGDQRGDPQTDSAWAWARARLLEEPAPTTEQYVRVFSPRINKVIYGTMLSHRNAPTQIRVTDPERIVYPFIIENSDDADSGIKPSIDQFLILPRPAPE